MLAGEIYLITFFFSCLRWTKYWSKSHSSYPVWQLGTDK